MIALQSISQVKYIVNNDSLVCYTNDENRAIAVIFLEGERDKELLNNCEQQVLEYAKLTSSLKQKLEASEKMINTLETSYTNVYDEVDKKNVENSKLRFRFNVSKAIIGLLIIGVLIK